MTVDSNHLRGLLKAAGETAYRLQVTDFCGADGVTIKHEGVAFGEWAEDDPEPAFIVAVCNNAEELLDRSDALDEAIALLRRADATFMEDWPYSWFESEGTNGYDVRAFLARFSEEAS